MSDDRSARYEFNTAITGLDPETGKFDEKAHREKVKPLRGLLMQVDGVNGVHIDRYEMQVDYKPNVISRTRLDKAVKAAFKEISGRDGFFPLKGKKTPSVRPVKRVATRSHTWHVVRVDFDTDLFVDSDEERTATIVRELLAQLVNTDGARDASVGQRSLSVRFDPRETEGEDLTDHLERVVNSLMVSRKENGYFPFGEPSFTYRAYRTNYVIM